MLKKRTKYRYIWKEEFLQVSHAAYLFNVRFISPCGMWRFLTALLVLCVITRFSWPDVYVKWSRSKKLSEAPLPRLTSSIDVRAFNLKWSLGPRMTFSWRDQKGWVHRVTYEIIAIWLGSEQIPCRILGRIYRYKSTIKAEWSQESTHETTTIWLEDRHEPMSTLGWEWTICK
jgi:hypothetical protein